LDPFARGNRFSGGENERWALGPFFVSGNFVADVTDRETLIALLARPVEALGYELVDLDVRVGGDGLLRVFIDHPEGIQVEDCEAVSRQLSAFLDVEDPLPGHYVLEISSPGIERRLRTLEHFGRFVGSEIKVELKRKQDGRRRLRGELKGVDDQLVVVDVEGEAWRLNIQDIARAHLVAET
jgi:ribosome maturation factor RimP